MKSQFTSALQLAKFLNQVTMDNEALAQYILDYAKYYMYERDLEMIADLRFEYSQPKLGISVNQTKNDEKITDDDNFVTDLHS